MDMPSLELGRMRVEQVRGAETLIHKLLNILAEMVTKHLGTHKYRPRGAIWTIAIT